jgi:NAD(P)-dependent dehydrogenase (short-subunit alcohol dehydrogenase family)
MSTVDQPHMTNRSLFALDGRTAIVTGAARGMGRALAFGLGAFGARVVLADLDGPAAEQSADELSDSAEAFAFQVDHTDEAGVAGLLEATQSRFGPVDILVNNAGVLSLSDFLEMDVADWDRVLEINLRGPLLCMKTILPTMTARGAGSIVNIGSSWSSRTSVLNQSGGGPDYCVSKSALQALTRSAAQSAGRFGVRVNAIAPGVVDTPMMADYRDLLLTNVRYIPLGRLQEPDDIVGAAVFLASDAGRYVTGQTIHVNGGLLMID